MRDLLDNIKIMETDKPRTLIFLSNTQLQCSIKLYNFLLCTLIKLIITDQVKVINVNMKYITLYVHLFI